MDTIRVFNIDLGTTRRKIRQSDRSPDSPAPARRVSLVSTSESTDLSSSHPSEETGIPDAHIIAPLRRNPAQECQLSAAEDLIWEECVLLPPSPCFYHWTRGATGKGKHWCEHRKASLHDWLRSLQAPCSYPKDCLDKIPRTNLHRPGGVKTGSIYQGEAYWHLCWVLSRSTGFRK